MKKRLLFLVSLIAGALLLANQFPVRVRVMPLPAPSARVRLHLPVRFAGDYRIEISMPKMDDKLTLSEETHACDLLASIDQGGRQILSFHILTMRIASEFGWGNVQTFTAGQSFHLDHGEYDATIIGGGGCPVAAARGASITIGRFEREHILQDLLAQLLAVVFLLAGMLGLVFSEFVRRPNKPLKDRPREEGAALSRRH
jgi:hypothetical protein